MVPEKGAHKTELDERLAEARDKVLLAGEQVVAQEPADQGQAIVLTDSRIIILKVGITATGMLNGFKSGVYPLGQVTGVSVRKGPMGAVIQVAGVDPSERDPGEKPESIVVFGGTEKVRSCDMIAEKIEATWGKPVERFEPKSQESTPPEAQESSATETTIEQDPQQPSDAAPEAIEPIASPQAEAAEAEPKQPKRRGGRVAKSLAEEMYEDISPEPTPAPAPVAHAAPPAPAPAVVEPEAVVEIVPEPVAPVIEAVQETPEPVVAEPVTVSEPELVEVVQVAAVEPEPEPEPTHEPGFRPNPNLPKCVTRKRQGPKKVLALLGALGTLMLMGLAITAPLRQQETKPAPEVNVNKLINSVSVLRKQYIAASSYKDQIAVIIRESDSTIAAVRAAVGSRNHQAVISALNKDVSDVAWAKMGEIDVPLGLAGAKECIVSGLFVRKSAVEGALTGSVSPAAVARKLAEADKLIAKGTATIDARLNDLQSRMPSAPSRHVK